MSVILFFWSSIKFEDEPYKTKHMWEKASIITTIVFLLAGWWFIRNFVLYKDLFGNKISLQYSQMYAIDEYKPSNRKTPQNLGYSVPYMLLQMGWLKESYCSFIGKFGYMSISLTKWMYWIYNIIFLGGLTGWIVKLKHRKMKKEGIQDKQKTIFYICMFASAIIPVFLSMYFSYSNGYQPQGRYWLPMLIPFMFFLVKGLEAVSDLLHRFKDSFLYIIILAVLVVAIACCFQVIPQNYF